jgi:hypothetical protein
VQVTLTIFTAEMRTCTLLPETFENGAHQVNLWMDGNDNKLQEPGEQLTENKEPDASGELCVGPLKLPFFVANVNFVYEIIDPQGQTLETINGSFDYVSNTLTVTYPGNQLQMAILVFEGATSQLTLGLSNPFTARLDLAESIVTENDPIQNCNLSGAAGCPTLIEVVSKTDTKSGPDSDSYWDNWQDRFKGNFAYVPLIVLGAGMIALLAVFWPWRSIGPGSKSG